MRVAILSESPADEAAVRILVEAVLGRETEPANLRRRTAARGVDCVFDTLGRVIKGLHYNTDTDALVVVVDSNHTPVQTEEGDPAPAATARRCRLQRLRDVVDEVVPYLKPVGGREETLKVALGLAVPAIEAWYLCGQRGDVSEEAWEKGLAEGRDPYSKRQLKNLVYGTDRPQLALEQQFAIKHARQLASRLDLLADKFPVGFGALRRDVSRW